MVTVRYVRNEECDPPVTFWAVHVKWCANRYKYTVALKVKIEYHKFYSKPSVN